MSKNKKSAPKALGADVERPDRKAVTSYFLGDLEKLIALLNMLRHDPQIVAYIVDMFCERMEDNVRQHVEKDPAQTEMFQDNGKQ